MIQKNQKRENRQEGNNINNNISPSVTFNEMKGGIKEDGI